MLELISMLIAFAIVNKSEKKSNPMHEDERKYVDAKTKEWRDAWEKLVLDNELENEITYKVNFDTKYRESITQEMKELFGDMYVPYIGVDENKSMEKRFYAYNEIRYLLAKQGKLRYSDVMNGYKMSLDETVAKKEKYFLLWMTDMIKSNIKKGDSPLLKEVELIDSTHISWEAPIVSLSQTENMPGKLMWNVEDSKYTWKRFQPEWREQLVGNGVGPIIIIMVIILLFIIWTVNT